MSNRSLLAFFWVCGAFVVVVVVVLVFCGCNLEGVSRHTIWSEPGRAEIRQSEVFVIMPVCRRIPVRRVLPLRRRCHFVGNGARCSVGCEGGKL